MGTEMVVYVIVGAKLDLKVAEEKFLWRAEDKWFEEMYFDYSHYRSQFDPNKLVIIDDCMGSEYCFVGYVLRKAIESDGIDPINGTDTKEHGERLQKTLNFLSNYDVRPEDYEFGIWTFTHFH